MSSLGLSNSKEGVVSYLEESSYGKKNITGYSEKLSVTFEEREITYKVESWLGTNMYFVFSLKI